MCDLRSFFPSLLYHGLTIASFLPKYQNPGPPTSLAISKMLKFMILGISPLD